MLYLRRPLPRVLDLGDSGAGRGQSSSSSSSAAVGNVPSLSVVDTGVGGEARNNAAVRPGEEASGGATAAPRITMRDFISKTKHQVISPSKEGSKRVKAGAKWLSRSKRKSGGRKTRSTRSKAEEISGGVTPYHTERQQPPRKEIEKVVAVLRRVNQQMSRTMLVSSSRQQHYHLNQPVLPPRLVLDLRSCWMQRATSLSTQRALCTFLLQEQPSRWMKQAL